MQKIPKLAEDLEKVRLPFAQPWAHKKGRRREKRGAESREMEKEGEERECTNVLLCRQGLQQRGLWML